VPGDDGFDAFYAACYGRLVGQLFAVTGDLHEAEDVVQEAFIRAVARWSRLRDYDVPEAWVRVLPSQSPSGILTPSVVIPSATTFVRSPRWIPSTIITAKRTSSRRRLISLPSERRVRSMKVRETDERDVDRACCSTSWPTGSCVLR
jgi:hypothetical protein